MESMPERQQFREQLVEILGEPIKPISDGVELGEIEWGWTADFSSFTVFIDSKGKIDLEVNNYPKVNPEIVKNATPAQSLQKARDFKSNHSL